jgi:hypothetical protein
MRFDDGYTWKLKERNNDRFVSLSNRAGVRNDTREVNVTVDYRIGRGVLESLWLRVRAAWLEESLAPKDATDFRVILRYELPVI